MADPVPPASTAPPAAPAATTATPPPPPPPPPPPKAPRPQNQALRMLGLPNLPNKLPSRNWMIFWTVSASITAAIIYDRREKRRNIAKWRHAVEHLAAEPITDKLGLEQPRKLTIYLSAPPGDGLRVAQDHYTEYVKPVLAASGLDWEFVQGRREGDVRAVVAERLRKVRRGWENKEEQDPNREPTKDELIEIYRQQRGIKDYEGVRGDVVIGRHTWKEYLRGLHEGWLGPLVAPAEPAPLPPTPAPAAAEGSTSTEDKPAEEKKKAEAPKPKRPPQPKPYNTTSDYSSETLHPLTPQELTPAVPIREPHILGFLNTPTRMVRFFNRRSLADDIGREVAAVCLATHREFQQQTNPDAPSNDSVQYEQAKELEWEEQDWPKKVWKEDEADADKEVTEKIHTKPVVMDPRLAHRMRRFALTSEDEDRVSKIKVPEEEVEGWIKGSLRKACHWGYDKAFNKKKLVPLEDKDVE
ncbi:mitochondrial import inner membrane translocase subunit tim-54 [Neurospora crassa]|nr:mitochondrial import inner membrane translocase subunit tim-54 [Neurospora crassa]